VLAEADMTSIDVSNGVSNDVLEVDSAPGTLKSSSAAALNDGMLAASAKLYPARHVRVPLRFESVRRREDALGSAIKAADEDLFAAFQVHTTRSLLGCTDLRVQAALKAARHHEARVAGEVPIFWRRTRTLNRVVERIPLDSICRCISSQRAHHQQTHHQHDQ
jgi:hypothetical protein